MRKINNPVSFEENKRLFRQAEYLRNNIRKQIKEKVRNTIPEKNSAEKISDIPDISSIIRIIPRRGIIGIIVKKPNK